MKKVRSTFYLSLFIIIMMVSACSNENDELASNFVGHWEIIGDRNYSVFKIYQLDGDFFADINVLKEKAPDGGVKSPAKLTVVDKDLYIKSPFIEGNIVFYKTDNRIVIGSDTSYTKLSESQFAEVKRQWNECEGLRQNYLKSVKAVPLGYDHSKKLNELRKAFKERSKGLKGC